MNAAITEMTHCPEPETLAAFVDGRLNAVEHQDVLNHLADCAECRDTVLLATEIKAAEAPAAAAANVVRPAFGWKKIAPLAAAAAIAAIVVLPMMRPNPMKDVVKTAKNVKERPTAARLDLDVPYRQARPVPRGGEVEVGSWETEQAALDAAARVEKKATVENLHAAGIAYMYDGQHTKAVEMLERADKDERTPSVALLNNLTAAYLASGRYQDALRTADRSLAIEQNLVALWNRALALEWGGRYDDAKAAWNTYLQNDRDSDWAKEVREKHLTDL